MLVAQAILQLEKMNQNAVLIDRHGDEIVSFLASVDLKAEELTVVCVSNN